jgi:HPt (histidine-containing phosphotransfer) domain-containing protein
MIDALGNGWVLPAELRHLALSGDTQAVGQLIALFKEDVAARLQVLRQAVITGDLAAGGAQAHSIQGSALQMGALQLAATCRHIELDAAHHVTENLPRLLLEAEADFRLLQTTMC